MTRDNNKSETLAKKSINSEAEFTRIKEGIKAHPSRVLESIRQKVGSGDWKLAEIDAPIDEGKDCIDLVFSSPDGKKEKYVIIDISVPHLGVGQKYALPGKAKLFQTERQVTAARIKKAIILIRKGTESISTSPLKLRCPIIEISYESVVKEQPKPRQEEKQAERARPENRTDSRTDNRSDNRTDNRPQNRKEQPQQNATDTKSTGTISSSGVSQELLFALKEAIVHECLSTMHKRCNKYIRKGLWRWIEREIMDPNVHFYLIILSSIYQGKTGEILSRRFKTPESYSSKPEEVIDGIFSRENSLADEIKKSAERHQRALTKFLACFSQTPPFEYLKSIFLKEFRTHADGLKARMTVYSTLQQLLERCGFEGEKEVRYPLEILDELKIFQGILTGNYASLRTDNAAKKLKHLVPQIEWTDEDIYLLRNQLAKALNLPAQEFNLNAFLPQAFFHDARHLAESRKEAIRAPISQNQRQPAREPVEQRQPAREPAEQRPQRPAPTHRPREVVAEVVQEEPMPHRPRQNQSHVRHASLEDQPERQEEAPMSRNREQPPRRHERSEPDEPAISVRNLVDAQNTGRDDYADPHDKRRPGECDESKHRYFENFGGHLEEDSDAIKLALAMDRYKLEKSARKSEEQLVVKEEPDDLEMLGVVPSKPRQSKPYMDMNPNPPRKHLSGEGNNNASPAAARNDRKRRFSKNQGQRNRPRRPAGPGASR
ncbi:MAG TPA: hypothetical protein DCG57_08005 [Candidatus Riflebacteria bacterium]|nr:hypothetical protein [Candidatus Riflebacteria bacterium]